MPYLAPGYLAKQAATVDVLSGGRLDLGLGIGWMPEEFTVAGATMARPRARGPAEYIEVLRHVWAGRRSPSSAARYYQVPAGRIAPRPVQRPGPPILLGGDRAGRAAAGRPATPTAG